MYENKEDEMASVDKFLKEVMHNTYEQTETDQVIKYYNDQYDVIQQKRVGKSCIVVDKRTHPIVYNDIHIALDSLLK
jgi:hypothetical protein